MSSNQSGYSYESAVACRKSREEIDKIGEDLFNEHGLEPGDDIVPILEKFGGSIEYLGMNDWFESADGSISVEGEREFKIFVSDFTGLLRNRFTIAHELGHYILHSDYGKHKIKAARSGTGRVESEANYFAAGFLMPKKLFTQELEKSKEPLHLASKFMVSIPAAEIRIEFCEQP